MSTQAAETPSRVLPFHDPSRRRRLVKVVTWLVGIAVVIVLLEPARGGRDRVAPGPLGPDQGDPRRLHRRRALLPDRRHGLRRCLVLRHPPSRLPGRGLVPADPDRLRRRRRDEQLPAREHRHARDAAHVRRDHPLVHVRRGDRRLPRAEDLLHARGDVRLPLPVPVRPGLVPREPRERDGQPASSRSPSSPAAPSCSSSSAASSGSR